MAQFIKLEIVTPTRRLFAGEVEQVSVPGRNGYMGILPGHAALLSELKVGVVSYVAEGEEKRLFCSWGFVEVLSDRVTVLAESAETPEEIDLEAARRQKEEAERSLGSKSPDTDFQAALTEWEESVARLEAAGDAVRH